MSEKPQSKSVRELMAEWFLMPSLDLREKKICARDEVMQLLDYDPLNNIDLNKEEGDKKLNRQWAINMIQAGRGDAVIKNINRFQDIEEPELVEMLFDYGQTKFIAKFANHLHLYDSSKIANRLIQLGALADLAEHLNSFKELDKSMAHTLIENGFIKQVAQNFNSFDRMGSAIATALIKAGLDEEVENNLDRFIDLNQTVAVELIELGYSESVIDHLSIFKKKAQSYIVISLIEEGFEDLFIHRLNDFDSKVHGVIAATLVEFKRADIVAAQFDQYQNIKLHKLIKKLIEYDQISNFINNLNCSDVNNLRVSGQLIQQGQVNAVIAHCLSFKRGSQLAQQLIDAGKIDLLIRIMPNFENFDQNIADQFIEAGQEEALALNLDIFNDLNFDTAIKLISAGYKLQISNSVSFFSDQIRIVNELIDQGFGLRLIYIIKQNNVDFLRGNAKCFSESEVEGFIDRLIETNQSEAVLNFFSDGFRYISFDNRHAAIEWLINMGYGLRVVALMDDENASYINQDEIVTLLIDRGEGYILFKKKCKIKKLSYDHLNQLSKLGYGYYILNSKSNYRLTNEELQSINQNFKSQCPGYLLEVGLLDDEAVIKAFDNYGQKFSPDQSADVVEQQTKNILSIAEGVERQLGASLGKIDPLIHQYPEVWQLLAIPTIISQKTGAFLCLNDITELYNHSVDFSEPKIINFLKFITTQMGIRAHDILKNLLVEGLKGDQIKNLSDESEILQKFLQSNAVPIPEIYEAYRFAHEGGDVEKFQEIIQVTSALQDRLVSGKCVEEDFNNRFFPAIVMYSFPPAIGVERRQYLNLISQREDRQRDVPSGLDGLQGTTISASKGGYQLKEGENIDDQSWKLLFNVVRESGETSEIVNLAELGRGLINDFSSKNFKDQTIKYNHLRSLYALYSQQGYSLPDSLSSHQNLMAYKVYVGDHLNDMIGLCLNAWKKEFPNEWVSWQQEQEGPENKNFKGIVKQLTGVIKNVKMTDEKKEEVLKNILHRQGFQLEGAVLQDLSCEVENENLSNFLSEQTQKRDQNQNKLNIMIKNALLGSEYSGMFEEMGKYEFIEGADQEEFQLWISKKKEHGCAGFNMGVCVTPDEQLWNNSNFMNVIMSNEKFFYGGMHFLIVEGKEKDSNEIKKYLTLPGINPSMSALQKASADDLYAEMIQFAKQAQKQLNCDQLLIPKAQQIYSNQAPLHLVVEGKKYKTFTFEEDIPFSYSPYNYSFQDCFVVD